MNLHLAIPDLLWPNAADPAVMQNLALPGLETLLGKGRRATRPNTHLEHWL